MNFLQLRNALLAQARSDAPGVVTNAGMWLNMAQLRVCRDLPPSGWWFTEVSESIPVNADGNVVVSSTPLQVREVILKGTRLLRIQSTNSWLFSGEAETRAFYDIGRTVVLVPPGETGSIARVVYDRALPELVNDSDTNVLLELFPDIVIHLGRNADAQFWESRYKEALRELMGLNARRRGRMVGDA